MFVRGTNSNQVLVLRDGVPLNDPSDPSGAYNFGVDTLADVERIEVVRGPMSGALGLGRDRRRHQPDHPHRAAAARTATVAAGAGLPLALGLPAPPL